MFKLINNILYLSLFDIIFTDLLAGHIEITQLIENMGAALTDKDAENREKGMKFFTKLLKELPKNFLTELQLKFISKFYTDRLKDNHRVIPTVIEGYSAIIDMDKYKMKFCREFLMTLFREVTCQSQLRQDRYNIYLIINKLTQKDVECEYFIICI